MRRFMLGLILFASGSLITAAVCRAAALVLLQADRSLICQNPWGMALGVIHGNIPFLIGLLISVVGLLLMAWQVISRR